MPEVLKLPNNLARDFADFSQPCGSDNFTEDFIADLAPYGIVALVENRHTGEQRRWSSIHELVLKTADGRLWRAFYSQGLTESQCEDPFEYEGEFIDFELVERVTVEHYDYRGVK